MENIHKVVVSSMITAAACIIQQKWSISDRKKITVLDMEIEQSDRSIEVEELILWMYSIFVIT